MSKKSCTYMILVLLLWSLSSFASKQTVLSCPMQNCEDCQLLIDVKEERAEYMDNESSYFLQQVRKEPSKRVFEAVPSKEISSHGYRIIFSRKSKVADLIEINFADKSEKFRYRQLKCKFVAETLTPTR
ncbi:MAG: hypothetical protein ACXVCY_18730 [Pseudobdellovibrionaceae bacterium]